MTDQYERTEQVTELRIARFAITFAYAASVFIATLNDGWKGGALVICVYLLGRFGMAAEQVYKEETGHRMPFLRTPDAERR
jgi:hypothetical protein